MKYDEVDFKWMKLDKEFEILDIELVSLPYWFYPYALDRKLGGLDTILKAMYDGEIFGKGRLLGMGEYTIRIEYSKEHYDLLYHLTECLPHEARHNDFGDLEYLYKEYKNEFIGLIILNYNERKIKKVPFTFRCDSIEERHSITRNISYIDIDGVIKKC